MVSDSRPPRLAVLIDAENVSAKVAEGLFRDIARLGQATVRRLYGDFCAGTASGWVEVLHRHGLAAQQQFPCATGKNGADIALVIDAMDLLHAGRVDGFCIVSSDSDFTRLAVRIMEHGVPVFGYGEKKAPESFRKACHSFSLVEELMAAPAVVVPKPTPLPAAVAPKAVTHQPVPDVGKLICQSLAEMDSEDGWVGLSPLGTHLRQVAPGFDARHYGSAKLSGLIRRFSTLELRSEPGGHSWVRRRVSGPRTAAPAHLNGSANVGYSAAAIPLR